MKGDNMTKKILIIEDDEELRRGLGIRLKGHGYKVIFAGDAISAISMTRKEAPDLIVLDLGLPGGDGFLVMQRLAAISNTVSVIILSARDPVANRERAIDAGAEAYFQKPADNEQLLTAIQKALGESAEPSLGNG